MEKMRKFGRRLWKDRTLIMMAFPGIVIMILFSYIPMTGLVLAFKKMDYSLGIYGSPWNGFANFKNLFLVGDTFWRITRNTLGYYAVHTILLMVLEVAFAIALNEMMFRKTAKYVQSIAIIPTFISYVAVSYIVNALLDYNLGVINNAMASAGMERINFYLKAGYWPFILTGVAVWKNTGYGSVIYLSALSGIDQGLYESADLDGATQWQKIRYITIPMLMPMITIKLLLSLGSAMKSGTGLYYQVTRNTGALYPTTQTIDAYLLNALASGTNWGAASAAGFYQSIVGFLLVIIVNLIVRRKAPESALF